MKSKVSNHSYSEVYRIADLLYLAIVSFVMDLIHGVGGAGISMEIAN